MSRLIAFGCSFTSGVGVEPEQAWPILLGQKLNIPAMNLGSPGASNSEILYNILTFDFDPDDIVVVMWTRTFRDIIFDKKKHRPLGPWQEDSVAKEWIISNNEFDYAVKALMQVHHVGLYLEQKNIKHIHLPYYSEKSEEVKTVCTFVKDIKHLYNADVDTIDYGYDNAHPGVKTHIQTAETIFKILNEQSK